jgi:hypothetical protein
LFLLRDDCSIEDLLEISGELALQAWYNLLVKVKNSVPDAKNAVAFLDPFGNVVLCFADTFGTSSCLHY